MTSNGWDNRMKRRLAQSAIGRRSYHLFNRMFGDFQPGSIPWFIHEYSRRRRSARFIQVGANDGITWDPFHFFIRRDRWIGVVLEPQRNVFETKLKATYEGVPGIELLNVAVDSVDGVRELYRYSCSESRWATGLASFDRDRLVANFYSPYIQDHLKDEGLLVSGNAADYITSEAVQCISFSTLLDRLRSDTIDFLLTGLDVQILETFPLERVRPANIVFELPEPFNESLCRFETKLHAYGYNVLLEEKDGMAIRRDVLAGLVN
jgi:hypothetical protein